MRSLGRPHRDQVVTTRPTELTILQAIDLSNGAILASTLTKGAQNLAKQGKSNDELIEWLYRHALARSPSPAERDIFKEITADTQSAQSIEDVLWSIFMLPEFQIIR